MGYTVMIGKPDAEQSNEDSMLEKVNVHIGVFFDGTGNNMMNIKERNEYVSRKLKYEKRDKYYESNDSHLNGFSNVANLYSIYNINEGEYKFAVYVEGIGTAPRALIDPSQYPDNYFYENGIYGDSLFGQALGIGAYGVNGKIESACKKIVSILTSIREKYPNPIEIQLTFNVFGFSRGAAAARSFTSRIKSMKGDTVKLSSVVKNALINSSYNFMQTLDYTVTEEYDYKVCLSDLLKESGFDVSDTMKVEFLGLYDTVSSYGVSFNDDVKELALTIDKSVVKKVFQICAADEYRRNFSLTLVNLNSPEEENYIIPGAHSDIGGGYSENMEEKYILYRNVHQNYSSPIVMNYSSYMNYSPNIENIYAGNKTKEELENDGWFDENDIKNGVRYVDNKYCYIALNLMIEKIESSFIKNKTEFNMEEEDMKDLKDFYEIVKNTKLYDFVVEKGKKRIKRNTNRVDDDLMKRIRHTYLHLSAKGEPWRKIIFNPCSIFEDKRFVNAARPGNIRKIIENA